MAGLAPRWDEISGALEYLGGPDPGLQYQYCRISAGLLRLVKWRLLRRSPPPSRVRMTAMFAHISLLRAPVLATSLSNPRPCLTCQAMEPRAQLLTPAAAAARRALKFRAAGLRRQGHLELVRKANDVARLFHGRVALSPETYTPGESYQSLNNVVRGHRGCFALSHFLFPLFGHAMGMPHEMFASFPPPRSWRMVVDAYAPLLAAQEASLECVVSIDPHVCESFLRVSTPREIEVGQRAYEVRAVFDSTFPCSRGYSHVCWG